MMNKNYQNFLDIYKKVKENNNISDFGSVELDAEGHLIQFSANGFSKSGTATIQYVDGKIMAFTRYNGVNVLEDYDDLVRLAFDWYARYHNDSTYGVPRGFQSDFIRLGLIKKMVEEKFVIA